tara:strand:+ start:31 stop:285 length:255 start_codon:yes stop_codon:yes gene_type:complete
MASLQELKNRLTNSSIKIEPPKKEISKTDISPESTILEIEEARYLLALIAKSEFSGKDIQIVYNSALKLQEIIKNNLDKDNIKE